MHMFTLNLAYATTQHQVIEHNRFYGALSIHHHFIIEAKHNRNPGRYEQKQQKSYTMSWLLNLRVLVKKCWGIVVASMAPLQQRPSRAPAHLTRRISPARDRIWAQAQSCIVRAILLLRMPRVRVENRLEEVGHLLHCGDFWRFCRRAARRPLHRMSCESREMGSTCCPLSVWVYFEFCYNRVGICFMEAKAGMRVPFRLIRWSK
jgi:hypothetical protein